MEYLEGMSLLELLNDRHAALPLEQLLSISLDVTNGLEAAHSRGIIHRDIKPANVFITDRGTAKILDFGLAKIEDSSQKANSGQTAITIGAALGTAAYMSPEQALGKRLDARSDLFSFGVMLYEMATGWRPFQGETTGILVVSIVKDTPTAPVRLNPSLPAELERIVNKALEKDPDTQNLHRSVMIGLTY
jgi:serine/threonine protein kinase